MSKIRLAGIQHRFLDWPTPEDDCIVVFLSGCKHNCDCCQTPDLQDFDYGFEIGIEELADLIKFELTRNRTDKLIFSGGDPLYRSAELNKLIEILYPSTEGLKITVYTGFDHDEAVKLIDRFDFIKTGLYVKELAQKSEKTNKRMVLASKNQQMWSFDGKLLSNDGIITF
jgi:anaerobic ribonucleoside-triphosphate reductase activating protein